MTADMIYEILRANNHANSSRIIAAAMDSLAREQDEAIERAAFLQSLARTGSNIAHAYKDEADRLRLKANAWDAREAWLAAENEPGSTESQVFPLIFAYEEAAKKAREAE